MASSSPFRFSPRPNSASEIPWREWDAEVFEAAVASDRPVLLSLAAAWAPEQSCAGRDAVFGRAGGVRASEQCDSAAGGHR